jgi:hypothetical protein
MANRPKGFPKELSVPIKWIGPTKMDAEGFELVQWGQPPIPRANGLAASILMPKKVKDEAYFETKRQMQDKQTHAESQVFKKQMDKLVILADHLGIGRETRISDNNWPLMLCMEMARIFFSGFEIRFEEYRGRRKKYEFFLGSYLVLSIQTIMCNSQKTLTDACRIHLRNEGNPRPTHGEVKSLCNRYIEVRKGEARILYDYLEQLGPEAISSVKSEIFEQEKIIRDLK